MCTEGTHNAGTTDYLEALEVLESDAKKLIDLCSNMVKAHDGDVYPFDLFANAAANRSLACFSGFRTLIRDKNLVCAGTLLRLQLDTAFRFYAGFLVADPHQFAMNVFAGKQIRKMSDMDGNQLTDIYSSSTNWPKLPWVKTLYDETCGRCIHLSGTHISHAIDGSVSENMTFTAKIGSVDRELSDESYLSAIMAFQQSTLIFVRYFKWPRVSHKGQPGQGG